MNTKYFVLIAAFLGSTHPLLAGSAPPATPAPVARQANVAPIAPTPIAPGASVGPIAPIGDMPSVAPIAPVTIAPIADLAHVAPIPPQSANPNAPYTFTAPYGTYSTNGPYFTNGVPTAWFKNNRRSVNWITNPPYGNPVSGYTNGNLPVRVRRVPSFTNNFNLPKQ